MSRVGLETTTRDDGLAVAVASLASLPRDMDLLRPISARGSASAPDITITGFFAALHFRPLALSIFPGEDRICLTLPHSEEINLEAPKFVVKRHDMPSFIGFSICPLEAQNQDAMVYIVRTTSKPSNPSALDRRRLEEIMTQLGSCGLPSLSIGIRFSYLKEFANRNANVIHEHTSCQDIWDTLLLDEDNPTKPYVSHSVPASALAPATTVVCYCWLVPFLSVLESMERNFGGAAVENEAFWIDLFCSSDPGRGVCDVTLDMAITATSLSFHPNINVIGCPRLLVAIHPFPFPTALQRARSLYELYHAHVHGIACDFSPSHFVVRAVQKRPRRDVEAEGLMPWVKAAGVDLQSFKLTPNILQSILSRIATSPILPEAVKALGNAMPTTANAIAPNSDSPTTGNAALDEALTNHFDTTVTELIFACSIPFLHRVLSLPQAPTTPIVSPAARITDRYGFVIDSAGNGRRGPGFILPEKEKRRRDDVELSREAKWAKMVANWDEWQETAARRKKIKSRIRKGIPHVWRGRVWPLLLDVAAHKARNPGMYAYLVGVCARLKAHQPLPAPPNPEWPIVPEGQTNARRSDFYAISLDLNRTFPNHPKFAIHGAAQSTLRLTLEAYSVYDPEVGYCQGMSYIMGVLVMLVDEEDAFWCFVSLLRLTRPGYRPLREMFFSNLGLVNQRLTRFDDLIRVVLPAVQANFVRQNVAASMFATQWLMTVFSSNSSFDVVLRTWDVWISEGYKAVLRVALALLRLNEKVLTRGTIVEIMETMGRASFVVDAEKVILTSVNVHFPIVDEYGAI
eukprot:c39253_g1_i1.p1 GENE.c39253_g1_i1~~c39253_g1_i1.p1  ORF type:complete len:812 (+),score=166.19 c39253_g1_i1:41-2437(+)